VLRSKGVTHVCTTALTTVVTAFSPPPVPATPPCPIEVIGNVHGGVARVLHFGMAREITQRELRNNSGEIMRQLDQGESFVVTRNGIPVGGLSPLRRHRFVGAQAAVAAFRGAPRVESNRLRADLDRAASQEFAPRG
jgi:antitoxin (DNA-binding transcriptional repressor) of toxin-antitoxin stability system